MEVLWADNKSKPYKEYIWGLSLVMVSKLILNEKPKVAIMATHLREHGFTGLFRPTVFFAFFSSWPLA
jgi:hypothetical protein